MSARRPDATHYRNNRRVLLLAIILSDVSLSQADAKYKELCHKITLDTARWSSFLSASRVDESKKHQVTVFHAEAQRAIGQVVVDRYMDKFSKFFANKESDQVAQVFKMYKSSLMAEHRLSKADFFTVVVIDYTKYGIISQDMLDWTVGLASKVLDNDPNGVLVVIAPIMENANIEFGESGERSRIEKKLRAKDLTPVLVTLIASSARWFVF